MKRPSKCPKRGGYITLQDWMVRHYHLYGRELILYAVIQSFSQDGDSFFTGSINYLSFWTGFSKPTVIKYLKQLVSDGLIMKEEIYCEDPPKNLSKEELKKWHGKHRHFCKYWTAFSRMSPDEQSAIISDAKKG